MNASSVKVAGDKVRARRIERGMRVEDLARRAGCSLKSIQNAESGKNIQVATLAIIAAALKVEPKALIEDGDASIPPERMFRVQIVIEGDMLELNKSDRLLNFVELLTKMLQQKDEIKITGVMSGSVILVLEMAEDDALRLVTLFPDFHEHAREAIREKLLGYLADYPNLYEVTRHAIKEAPEGTFYFDISADTSPATFVMHANKLSEVAEAVRELRIVATPDSVATRSEDRELIGISRQHDVNDVAINNIESLKDMLENILRPPTMSESEPGA